MYGKQNIAAVVNKVYVHVYSTLSELNIMIRTSNTMEIIILVYLWGSISQLLECAPSSAVQYTNWEQLQRSSQVCCAHPASADAECQMKI